MPETVKGDIFGVFPVLSPQKGDAVTEDQRKNALFKTFDVEFAPVVSGLDIYKRFFNDDGGTLHCPHSFKFPFKAVTANGHTAGKVAQRFAFNTYSIFKSGECIIPCFECGFFGDNGIADK